MLRDKAGEKQLCACYFAAFGDCVSEAGLCGGKRRALQLAGNLQIVRANSAGLANTLVFMREVLTSIE